MYTQMAHYYAIAKNHAFVTLYIELDAITLSETSQKN